MMHHKLTPSQSGHLKGYRCGQAASLGHIRRRHVSSSLSSTQSNTLVGSSAPARQTTPTKIPWRVRPLTDEDIRPITSVLARSFHEGVPITFLDAIMFKAFEAEVLDGLRKKQSMMTDSFTVLVADDWAGQLGVVGVVEVGILEESEVLEMLPVGVPSYAYISSMAVDSEQRRRGAAGALLHAGERQAVEWGQEWVCLHVYEENTAAINLYSSKGYQQVAKDPSWKAVLGGRIRLLMAKPTRLCKNPTLNATLQ